MHVCVLTDDRFPPNERLERQASALHEAGHAVTVCARGTDGQPEREILDGIDVRRLPEESLYAGAKGKLDGVRYALRFIQPAWLRAVSEVNDERPVDICCVSDLSLVKTGLKVGNQLDVPVVGDLPHPTAAVNTGTDSHGGRLRGFARRVFHSPWRRNRLVSKSLPDADRLVTTIEEARAEYVREKGLDPRNVAVVRDTVSLDSTIETDRDRGLGFDPEDAFLVTVFADNTPPEELETTVEAAARAADSAADLRLLLVGDVGQDTLDDLETLARRQLAGGRVTFRTETDDITEYVAVSDVCVFPDASQAAETTVPAELFEAMAFGVPVVVSDGTARSRIISRTNAGRVVSSGEREALTEALVVLADGETATELGANGRRAVEREYNFERDADRLRTVYESFSVESQAEESVETNSDSSLFANLSERLPWPSA
jgi:glycosyltransferase involved in cell wall biosynthesis